VIGSYSRFHAPIGGDLCRKPTSPHLAFGGGFHGGIAIREHTGR
jgi:hypothetical protein